MVIIYSTPTCVYCKQVKKYLDMKNIQWEERDAFASPEYGELAQKYGMTVPLIIVGDQGMVGYNIGRLNELLSAA